MSELELLSRLSSNIDTVRLRNKTYSSRVKISKYVETLQATEESSAPPTIPKHIQGYHRKYLEASYANAIAKKELALLQKETRNDSINAEELKHSNPLVSHLEVLRLRQQHHHYNILSHYASEAEAIASKNKIYTTDPVVIDDNSTHRQSSNEAEEISALTSEVQSLKRNIEIALLQMNHKIQCERKLLEELRGQMSASTDLSTPSNEAKLHALSVTRADLTNWIETSLLQCDVGQNQDQTPSVQHDEIVEKEQDPSPNCSPPNIERQYVAYIEARKRLINAVSSIQPQSQPRLRPHNTNSSSSIPKSASVQSKSTQSSTLTSNTHQDLLLQIQKTHFPSLYLSQTLDQYISHLTSLLKSSTEDLSSTLSRLRDESHLLSSYPIQFSTSSSSNPKSTYINSKPSSNTNSRPNPNHKRTNSTLQQEDSSIATTTTIYSKKEEEKDPSNNETTQNPQPSDLTLKSEQESITHLLKSWTFAKEAAQNSITGQIEKQYRQGSKMVGLTFDTVGEMELLEGLWRELELNVNMR